MSGRTLRYILIGGLVLAIGVPSVAMGFGEGRALILGKRNPSGHRTLTKETQIIGNTSTYATRQSNKKIGDGGGAIYGCRSDVGHEPCILTRNLRDGRAFQFETAGKEGGYIKTGDTSGAPFTTNATGVATGLNADRVDGKEATDFAGAGDLLAARVTAAGTLAGGRGATAAAIETGPDTYRVTFGRDVSTCTYTATPQGDATNQTLAVQAGSNPQNVRVDADAPTAFQLQVIC
jgi:hypothetical protein